MRLFGGTARYVPARNLSSLRDSVHRASDQAGAIHLKDFSVVTTWACLDWWAKCLSRNVLRASRAWESPQPVHCTQLDPIGLAGGLNSYGFAAGDPITYSDPFGLCPVCLGWAVVEAAFSVVDLVDLGVTAVKFAAGSASRTELAVTAAGTALGLIAPGGGLGRGGRVALEAADSWGNAATLARHFRDHGAEVGARSAREYADMGSDFLQRGLKDGLPTKIDADGVIRIYDPSTNTFGAFNADGTTRTLFKPTSKTYWDRQPGTAPQE
jgi:hypothetical protein